jgi:hypothetical protein
VIPGEGPCYQKMLLPCDLQACRYLVIDFGASRSPKPTRQRGSQYAPAAPRPLRPAQSTSHGARNGPAAPGCVYRISLCGLLRKHLAPAGDYSSRASPCHGGQRLPCCRLTGILLLCEYDRCCIRIENISIRWSCTVLYQRLHISTRSYCYIFDGN